MTFTWSARRSRRLWVHHYIVAAALAVVLGLTGCASSGSVAPTEDAKDDTNGTGSIAVVERDDVDRPIAHAQELLEGRVAGVRVMNTSSGIKIQIRGPSTVMGDGEPLYLVDDMPVLPGPDGALTGINPNDIARIKVLKDASATAIYGTRGAHGVVIVETKRGQR